MIVIPKSHQNEHGEKFVQSYNCNFINLSQDLTTSRRTAAVALECISFHHTLFKESSLVNFYQHNQLKLKFLDRLLAHQQGQTHDTGLTYNEQGNCVGCEVQQFLPL
jgi:YD repeat-containing protein